MTSGCRFWFISLDVFGAGAELDNKVFRIFNSPPEVSLLRRSEKQKKIENDTANSKKSCTYIY